MDLYELGEIQSMGVKYVDEIYKYEYEYGKTMIINTST